MPGEAIRNGDHQAGTDVASSVVPATPSNSTAETSTTEQQTSFKYRPLEPPAEIRIVILGRGSGDDPIECSLLHTHRSKQPYEALSYEWGLPRKDGPIISVDGCHVRVQPNLRDALMQIRLKEKDRYIWIDALSIDQKLTEERNLQVKMMGNIYEDAQNIIVWLGPAKDDSNDAMDMFAEPNVLEQSFDGFEAAQLAAILALCERSYWRRVWIQQEVYLAQRFEVHCGSKCISDTNFSDALGVVARNDEHFPDPRKIKECTAIALLLRKRAPPRMNTLRVWLLQSIRRKLESSEPRDFIYAMIGISHNCRGRLLPDYNKPLLEVYLETVALCRRTWEPPDSSGSFPRLLAEKIGLTYDENLKGLTSEFN